MTLLSERVTYYYYVLTYPRIRKREPLIAQDWIMGLHDNVPDRPTDKVAPVGCQLATMALKHELKLSLSQDRHGGLVVKASAS